MDDADDELSLGPCCICDAAPATVIVMLPRRQPEGESGGWGCVQCGIEGGAMAGLCELCAARYNRNRKMLQRCIVGYPAERRRMAIADLPKGALEHDPAHHPEERQADIMAIGIEATAEIKDVVLPGNLVVPVRVWTGRTAAGTPIIAYVVGVVPLEFGPEIDREFAALQLLGTATAARH